MSKTNLCKPLEDLESLNVVWGVIEKYKSIRHLTTEELAIKMHYNTCTYSNHSKAPEKISLERFMRYARVLNIPMREIAEALIGERIVMTESDTKKCNMLYYPTGISVTSEPEQGRGTSHATT